MKNSDNLSLKISRSVFLGVAICTLFFATLAWMGDSEFYTVLNQLFPTLKPSNPHIELTDFTFKRKPGEFTLFVRLKNSSRATIKNLYSVISIFDSDGNQLDTIVYPINQGIIKPGEKTKFTISFTETIPITSYSIYFKDKEGHIIPHTAF